MLTDLNEITTYCRMYDVSHYLNVSFEFFMNNMYLLTIVSNHEIKIALWTNCTIVFHFVFILSEWKIRECFGKKIWIQVLNYFEPNVMPYPRSKDDERQKGLWKCLGPGSSPPSAWLNTVDDYLCT